MMRSFKARGLPAGEAQTQKSSRMSEPPRPPSQPEWSMKNQWEGTSTSLVSSSSMYQPSQLGVVWGLGNSMKSTHSVARTLWSLYHTSASSVRIVNTHNAGKSLPMSTTLRMALVYSAPSSSGATRWTGGVIRTGQMQGSLGLGGCWTTRRTHNPDSSR